MGFIQKNMPVFGFTQRLGCHRPDLIGLESGQPFSKSCQALPAALHGFGAQIAVFVQTAALSHGFLDVLRSLNEAMAIATNF